MIHNTIVAAPDELRDVLREMTRMQLVRTLAAWRPDLTDYRIVTSANRIAPESLGRRYLELHDEIADLDAIIIPIVEELAPALVARNSIGHGSAAQLLLTAGDNVERLNSEASFAALCGASPVPASSGTTTRHRLNRGVIARQKVRCTSSPSAGYAPIHARKLTWRSASQKAIRSWRSSSPTPP